MSNWKSKLARYNTNCCEQVMPVPRMYVFGFGEAPKPIYNTDVSSCVVLSQLACPNTCNSGDCNGCLSITVNGPIYIYPPCDGIPIVGGIYMNTTGSVPSAYLLCDGSELSRTTYVAVFNVIGIYYGAGDGTTTFNLPNITNKCDPTIQYIIKT